MRILSNLMRSRIRMFGGMATVAAAGSKQSDATAISASFNSVTSADNSAGVILPSRVLAGYVVAVLNTKADKTLKVYPPSGGDINNGSDNAAVVLRAAQMGLFIALGGGNWAAVYDTDTTS